MLQVTTERGHRVDVWRDSISSFLYCIGHVKDNKYVYFNPDYFTLEINAVDCWFPEEDLISYLSLYDAFIDAANNEFNTSNRITTVFQGL